MLDLIGPPPEPTPPHPHGHKLRWLCGFAFAFIAAAWWAWEQWQGNPKTNLLPWGFGGESIFLGRMGAALVVFLPLTWALIGGFNVWLDSDHARRHTAWREECAERIAKRAQWEAEHRRRAQHEINYRNSVARNAANQRLEWHAKALAVLEPQLLLDHAMFCLDTRFSPATPAPAREEYRLLQWRRRPMPPDAWRLLYSDRPEVKEIVKDREADLPLEVDYNVFDGPRINWRTGYEFHPSLYTPPKTPI